MGPMRIALERKNSCCLGTFIQNVIIAHQNCLPSEARVKAAHLSFHFSGLWVVIAHSVEWIVAQYHRVHLTVCGVLVLLLWRAPNECRVVWATESASSNKGMVPRCPEEYGAILLPSTFLYLRAFPRSLFTAFRYAGIAFTEFSTRYCKWEGNFFFQWVKLNEHMGLKGYAGCLYGTATPPPLLQSATE